jgi:fructan beta-fructosidase
VYTSHNKKAENEGRIDYQNQSIAYSIDEGTTWLKYGRNPVLKNPGIKDFRDPKVSWYEADKKWIMTLATEDCVTFYSSADLKNWTRETDFGKTVGAHGGVWECPDLFPLKLNGKQHWVLLVSINPGAPNGGSGTQYFVGDFDGRTFTPIDTKTRWLDYGPDDYAGITWSNTGDRKIFIGWMSNWEYANVVPTKEWRSATTIPRELTLQQVDKEILISSKPVTEFNLLSGNKQQLKNIAGNNYDLTGKTGALTGPARIEIKSDKPGDFSMNFTNQQGEKIVVGFDKSTNNYFIDRTASGKVDFNKAFAGKHTAPRLSKNTNTDITLIVDNASIELFADNGLTVMTAVFFPNTDFSNITIQPGAGMIIRSLDFIKLKSNY